MSGDAPIAARPDVEEETPLILARGEKLSPWTAAALRWSTGSISTDPTRCGRPPLDGPCRRYAPGVRRRGGRGPEARRRRKVCVRPKT